MAPQLRHRAVAIAEYTDTSVFIPELDEAGDKVPPNWFGLNPEHSADSGEEIASSDEGEEEEDEDEGGEGDAPGGEDDGRPQPDQVSTNGRDVGEPTAAGSDQTETHQAATPLPEASASVGLSDPAAAPLA